MNDAAIAIPCRIELVVSLLFRLNSLFLFFCRSVPRDFFRILLDERRQILSHNFCGGLAGDLSLIFLHYYLLRRRLTGDYYSFLDDVFSTYASAYAEGYWKTRIAGHFRRIVWNELRDHVKPGGLAFDLGAGSGMDSVFLAKAGMKVIAWDISREMVRIMTQRIVRENLQDMITIEHQGSNNVPDLAARDPHAFDLILSNFGALNSEPNLPRLVPHFHKLLRNDGVFFGTIYNKFSLYETMGAFLKADFEKLTRRFRNMTCTEIGALRYPVTVYTPANFRSILRPYFRTVMQRGILMGLPSLNMLRVVESIPRQVLEMEHVLSNLMEHFPFLWLSDQFMNVARPS